MARSSSRPVLIAIVVFVVVAAVIKLAGAPIVGWIKTLHAPASGGH
jgi:hypothetical protein